MPKASRIFTLDYLWLRVMSPLSWPVEMRRLFLLLLPVSAPLYLLLILLLLVVMLICAIARPIAEFWSAPPQRLRSGSYYEYGSGQNKRRRREREADPELPLDD